VTQFATAKAGLILVNINPAYRVAELEYVLNKVGCRALVHADRDKGSDYIAMLLELLPEIAHFKVARYVKLVEDVPMAVTGKAQKFVMRDLMKQELGHEDERTA